MASQTTTLFHLRESTSDERMEEYHMSSLSTLDIERSREARDALTQIRLHMMLLVDWTGSKKQYWHNISGPWWVNLILLVSPGYCVILKKPRLPSTCLQFGREALEGHMPDLEVVAEEWSKPPCDYPRTLITIVMAILEIPQPHGRLQPRKRRKICET